MSDPATWVALATAIGGTAVSANAQSQQRKQQRTIMNRQLDTTAKTSEKAAELVKDEGQKYQADTRGQAMQAAEEAAFAQAQADLGGAGAGIIDGAGDTGNVSQDYLKAKADKTLTEGNRLTTVARELSKLRAPTELLNSEGLRRAELAGNLNNRWSTTRNLTNAGVMDAQQVEEPWWGNVGRVAQSYGLASAAGSLGGGASPTGGTGLTLDGVSAAQPSAGYLSGGQFGNSSGGGWWSNGGRAVRFKGA